MQCKGKVLSAESTPRDIVGKDGNKRKIHIARIVILANDNGQNEVMSVKKFHDGEFELPKIGSEFSTSFRSYENKDGIGNVVV